MAIQGNILQYQWKANEGLYITIYYMITVVLTQYHSATDGQMDPSAEPIPVLA